jgi:hypothetical protein
MKTSASVLKNMTPLSCPRANEFSPNLTIFFSFCFCATERCKISKKYNYSWAGKCHHIFFRGGNRALCGLKPMLKFPFDIMRYGAEQGRQSQL